MSPVGFVAVTNGEGTLQLSEFRSDGSLVRRLTTGPADHNFPSLSPDGKRFAFTGDEGGTSEIYVRDLDRSSPVTELTQPPLQAFSPSWSPDGKAIVYSALAPGSPAYQIYAARPDGSSPVQLTHTTDTGNTQPVYSPDGRRIAYVNGADSDRVWVMSSDGSGAAPLTPGPRDAYPAWLDNASLLFAREDVSSGTARIIRVGLDGREHDASPLTQRFIEPRPLPGGRAFGATIEEGDALHLVTISRSDGAPLTTQARSDFVVLRIPVHETEGSVFTLAWILPGPPKADPAGPILAAVALGAAALLVIAGFGWHTLAQKNERVLVLPGIA